MPSKRTVPKNAENKTILYRIPAEYGERHVIPKHNVQRSTVPKYRRILSHGTNVVVVMVMVEV